MEEDFFFQMFVQLLFILQMYMTMMTVKTKSPILTIANMYSCTYTRVHTHIHTQTEKETENTNLPSNFILNLLF